MKKYVIKYKKDFASENSPEYHKLSPKGIKQKAKSNEEALEKYFQRQLRNPYNRNLKIDCEKRTISKVRSAGEYEWARYDFSAELER
ncbi:hypothetical protein SDC9_114075 [bioreactor metagenome]|uniref:Uncharacterized protein n=1 Tax=bioreactor metagenome TaxID=1076179 RepID=A0A645BPV7_9ZZZZ